MKKKLIVTFVLCLVMCLNGNWAFAAQKDVKVVIDGQAVAFADAVPFIDENGRTQVPLRALAESMQYGVQWDNSTRTAYLFKVSEDRKTAICFKYVIDMQEVESLTVLGSNFTITDDLTALEDKITGYGDTGIIKMDTAPMIKDSRTFIPVRYVAELFNNAVEWDNIGRTVIITNGN